MPPKKGASRRVERCCYVESGVRCRRSGTGEPCLCNPHRIVMSEAGRPPPAFGDGVKNLVDRYINGRRVTRKVWEGALGDVMAAFGASQAPPQQPPPGAIPNQWREFLREQARAANARAQQQQRKTQPPADPAVEERRRARIVLGFTPSEALTLEMIQKRRRELARKHHPDRGGSVAKMQAVNAAADVLEGSV